MQNLAKIAQFHEIHEILETPLNSTKSCNVGLLHLLSFNKPVPPAWFENDILSKIRNSRHKIKIWNSYKIHLRKKYFYGNL